MRPSKRTEILEAAVRVAARHGARGVTLEAVAAEAGVTRGGMTYHFHDREALAVAIQHHLADRWEQELVEAAGAPAADLSPRERVLAYAEVSMRAARPGELQLVLNGAAEELPINPWTDVVARWTPDPSTADQDPEVVRLLLVRMAADGIWSSELMGGGPLDPGLRVALAEAIRGLVESP
ncbi:MAG: TetR/AcrR family transcriptional regulator [Aeromicrobium sp.]